MDFLKPAKYFFTLSTVLTIASIVLVIYPGPRFSIEFTGGTRMQVAVADKTVTADKVIASVRGYNPDLGASINRTQNGEFVVRMKGLSDEQHKGLLAHLKTDFKEVSESSYTTIGPTVGESLKRRAAMAVVVAAIGIILYLAFAFRTIPRKYSPWKFGITAVLTIVHDVMVTVGIFVILSRFTSFEVDTLFVTALLTVLGYSVNDTIVIFDRIRDNLYGQERKEDFAVIANRSVNHVLFRSIMTGASTLIMLLSLFFFGSESIKWFVLTLIVGIVLGTYSSIFVATPLLVYWNGRSKNH